MELTFEEYELLRSIQQRYVNMTKKFMPGVDDFEILIQFITELHNIHNIEKKIILNRVAQVREAKDIADESPCSPFVFFKYKSKFAEFKKVWREMNSIIYTQEAKQEMTASYALNPRISRIDIGYHINRTDKENGADLLAIFDATMTATRITFSDSSTIDIPSLEQDDLNNAHKSYNEKLYPLMTMVL